MSGDYPDGENQSTFDNYWDEKLNPDPEDDDSEGHSNMKNDQYSELILSPIPKRQLEMPRTEGMKPMPVPDWVLARCKTHDRLDCEIEGNETRWLVNGILIRE